MYVVGTDRIAVHDQIARPAGHRHAVDPRGRALCRSGRPRFTWPALRWTADTGDETCPRCLSVEASSQPAPAVLAYPDEAVAHTVADAAPVEELAAAEETAGWW